MEVKTVKFEVYPEINPTGYAVGFQVEAPASKLYRDALVLFSEVQGMSVDGIIQFAWGKACDADEINRLKNESTAPILGQKFRVTESNALEKVTTEVMAEKVKVTENVGEPEVTEDPIEQEGILGA